MSDPDRLQAVVARTDAIIAAGRADAERVLQTVLNSCGPECGCNEPRPDRPLKVKDLHAMLAEHIAHGRGDDDVYVYPGRITYDDQQFMDAWGQQHNYPIVGMDWTDDRDAFVTLTFDRTQENDDA